MVLPTLLASLVLTAAPVGQATMDAVPVVRFSFEQDEDRDYDGLPDDWTRRRGPGFPHYVPIEIDRTHGCDSAQSLRLKANGGAAVLYSPPQPVDSRHAYVFTGAIRTEKLQSDAVLVSISFLNAQRQRIQRWLSRPVTGTHADWVPLSLGPLQPADDVRFAVLGCHLVPGERPDIGGQAWFDELAMRTLPRLAFDDDVSRHFVNRSDPLQIGARVSGLDSRPAIVWPLMAPGAVGPMPVIASVPTDSLTLQLHDGRGRLIREQTFPLPLHLPPDSDGWLTWTVESPGYGYYQTRAVLRSRGQVILVRQSALVVLDLTDQPAGGEFGWSLAEPVEPDRLKSLANVVEQAGVNWLKLPLWSSGYHDDGRVSGAIANVLVRLQLRNITPVGVLDEPPEPLRRKFESRWNGVSEIFLQKPAFWWPFLEPVLAQYSTTVRHWQLGGDRDASFQGLDSLDSTLTTVKSEFDRIGRDVVLGVRWDLSEPPPPRGEGRAFLALGGDGLLDSAAAGRWKRWVHVTPLPQGQVADDDRAADLIRQMVAAKIANAEAIFLPDVIDPARGLLNPDGSPTPLFLPWRTTAQALRGSEYLGSLTLPFGSENHAFVRSNGEVVLVVWNTQPVTETVYLGEANRVRAANVWGEWLTVPVDPETGQQRLSVGPSPLVIRGCSEPVARWRMGIAYERGRQPSATGVHRDALVGRNTFSQGISGTVTMLAPDEWDIEPRTSKLQLGPGESFRCPIAVKLPPNVTLGPQWTALDFEIDADRKYRFRVYQPYHVGLGDVEMEVADRLRSDGTLEIELTIINSTQPAEVLNFDCNLFIPGAQRQKATITRLGPGRSIKLFTVPHAERHRGQEFWLRATEIDGRRVLNYRWTVEPPDSAEAQP